MVSSDNIYFLESLNFIRKVKKSNEMGKIILRNDDKLVVTTNFPEFVHMSDKINIPLDTWLNKHLIVHNRGKEAYIRGTNRSNVTRPSAYVSDVTNSGNEFPHCLHEDFNTFYPGLQPCTGFLPKMEILTNMRTISPTSILHDRSKEVSEEDTAYMRDVCLYKFKMLLLVILENNKKFSRYLALHEPYGLICRDIEDVFDIPHSKFISQFGGYFKENINGVDHTKILKDKYGDKGMILADMYTRMKYIVQLELHRRGLQKVLSLVSVLNCKCLDYKRNVSVIEQIKRIQGTNTLLFYPKDKINTNGFNTSDFVYARRVMNDPLAHGVVFGSPKPINIY